MSESEIAMPHFALFPAAGMGHLTPFLRLAAVLDSRGCAVTIIAAAPAVSAAEADYLSKFLSIHQHINRLELQLVPHEKSALKNDDPFFIQMERIGNSVHLLLPLLSSLSPPLSAIVVDHPVLSRLSHISIPMYTLITTSARFFSCMVHLTNLASENNEKPNNPLEIPFLGSIPRSSLPPIMLDPNHFFGVAITTNTNCIPKLKGVLINTFSWFESKAIEALRRNGVEHILPVGPLKPLEMSEPLHLPWLDEQAPESVIYISFGSRTALSKEQITELAAALESTNCVFLWVLKGKKVDKEDKEEIAEMVGEAFLEKTKGKGMVVKGWVDQERILAHPAVGGFVSHCGWNSVTEAAAMGVPVVAWPTHGDQRVNAAVVEEMGLGVWERGWGWLGERLIGKDEIAEKLGGLMGDERMRKTAKMVREKAMEARERGGSSEMTIQGLIQSLQGM